MIAGIDLGKTNSAVAVFGDGVAQLVPNALGDALTPLAVCIADDDAVLVGLAARDRRATYPQAPAKTFKRLMGTGQTVKLGRTTFTPEELSALVVRSMVADVEAATGEAVIGVVITVPAYLNDRQRKATRRAGELAGVRVERLINEPTAAALAFGVADHADRAVPGVRPGRRHLRRVDRRDVRRDRRGTRDRRRQPAGRRGSQRRAARRRDGRPRPREVAGEGRPGAR